MAGRQRSVTRRLFLVAGLAATGGVAFAALRLRRSLRNPLLADLSPEAAALTPYVLVEPSGVTLIAPRADMGQGARSVQAALLAEELEIALDQVRVIPGRPAAAYHNGLVAVDLLPFAQAQEGALVRGVAHATRSTARLMGVQITGGSTTVADGFDTLRMAGAVARETLRLAAAQILALDPATLRAQDGAIHAPDGRRLDYGALAATAAGIDPPDRVALKPPGEWRLLGRPMQRIDIADKSTGTTRFGIDLAFPGLLFATARTLPASAGQARALNLDEVVQEPGVLAALPLDNGAAVVARSTWHAFRAAEAIRLDIRPADPPVTDDRLRTTLARTLDEDRPDTRLRDDGDIDAALRDGSVLNAEYSVPFLAHAPLEPMNATVLFGKDRLDVWVATQVPLFLRDGLASRHGMARADVHVHDQLAGGSFGRRLEADFAYQAAEIAAALPGRPVRMTWTREQDMANDMPRPMALCRARGRADTQGIEAMDLAIASFAAIASQAGRLGYPFPLGDKSIVDGAWDQPMAIPHCRVRGYRAPEIVPVSSWRSVGASANAFFHECFLDELCHAAGLDPLAERLRLCNHDRSRRVLEAVGEMSGWGSAPLPPGRGRGLAFCMSFGVPVAQVVEVEAGADGLRVTQAFVAADVGRVIDPVNFENQVQGGVAWGLGHAIAGALTFEDGQPQERNFDSYPPLRIDRCPRIQVRALELGGMVRGIGEPPVPPAAPALANAIFAATGQRLRSLPLSQGIDFA